MAPTHPRAGYRRVADKTLVHRANAPKVDPAADAAVWPGLLGCGVMAGLGAAVNTGAVTRDDTGRGDRLRAVLGDAAIAGRAARRGQRIIAVDTDNRKLDWARGFRRHANHQRRANSTR